MQHAGQRPVVGVLERARAPSRRSRGAHARSARPPRRRPSRGGCQSPLGTVPPRVVLDGVQDLGVAGAAAQVPRQPCAQLLRGRAHRSRSSSQRAVRTMPGVQKPHCAAPCARKASCSGCRPPSSATRPFERRDRGAGGLHREHEARVDRLAVEQDAAGAADALAAAVLDVGGAGIRAQHLGQRLVHRHVARAPCGRSPRAGSVCARSCGCQLAAAAGPRRRHAQGTKHEDLEHLRW